MLDKTADSVYSFWEDGDADNVDEAVKTPGGRKYHQLEPIRPTNPTLGMRRSNGPGSAARPWEDEKLSATRGGNLVSVDEPYLLHIASRLVHPHSECDPSTPLLDGAVVDNPRCGLV